MLAYVFKFFFLAILLSLFTFSQIPDDYFQLVDTLSTRKLVSIFIACVISIFILSCILIYKINSTKKKLIALVSMILFTVVSNFYAKNTSFSIAGAHIGVMEKFNGINFSINTCEASIVDAIIIAIMCATAALIAIMIVLLELKEK